MCMRKVPRRLADRWDCHSGAREELIPVVLTLVISEGEMGEQKPEKLDLFVFEHFVMYIDLFSGLVFFFAFRTCRKFSLPCKQLL